MSMDRGGIILCDGRVDRWIADRLRHVWNRIIHVTGRDNFAIAFVLIWAGMALMWVSFVIGFSVETSIWWRPLEVLTALYWTWVAWHTHQRVILLSKMAERWHNGTMDISIEEARTVKGIMHDRKFWGLISLILIATNTIAMRLDFFSYGLFVHCLGLYAATYIKPGGTSAWSRAAAWLKKNVHVRVPQLQPLPVGV